MEGIVRPYTTTTSTICVERWKRNLNSKVQRDRSNNLACMGRRQEWLEKEGIVQKGERWIGLKLKGERLGRGWKEMITVERFCNVCEGSLLCFLSFMISFSTDG